MLVDHDVRSSIDLIAKHRRTDPSTLARQLRGDLDWIVMKAIEKDRARRYDTARAFALDIQRHLSDEPVEASPPSAAYRVRKFARRHRGAFVAATIIIAVFVLGLIGTSVGMILAMRNADLANDAMSDAMEQADIARAVTEFLNEDLLASVDPGNRGRDITVREVLEEASARLGSEFADQPLVAATLHHTIGKSWMALGVFDRAQGHLERAHRMRREILGPESRETLMAAGTLGGLYLQRGRYADAAQILAAARDTARQALGPDDEVTLGISSNLGVAFIELGENAQAREILTDTFQREERVLGKDHTHTIMALGGLANLAWRMGQAEEALQLYNDILERQKRALRDDHPLVLTTMANIANANMSLRRFADAEAIHRDVLARRGRVLGEDHPDAIVTMINLSLTLLAQSRADEARDLLQETVARADRVLGPRHPHALTAKSLLARRLGPERLDEAIALLREVLDAMVELYGAAHPETITARSNLVLYLRQHGRTDEIEAIASEHMRLLYIAASRSDADAETLNTAAWELLTAEPQSLRDPAAAMEFAQRACAIGDDRNPYHLDTLARAHFAAGNVEKAIEIQTRALELVDPDDANRSEIEAGLELFKQARGGGEGDEAPSDTDD